MTTPKTIAILGFLAFADAAYHSILPHLFPSHDPSLDQANYVAGETAFFISAVTLLVAEVLYAIDKRLKALEDKANGG